MDEKLKEKLSDPGLLKKMKKETIKLVKELYLKDLQYGAGILEIQINEDGNTICTAKEQAHFLTLLYVILNIQERILKNARNSMLADIKQLNSKVAEELINFDLSQEE